MISAFKAMAYLKAVLSHILQKICTRTSSVNIVQMIAKWYQIRKVCKQM